MQMTPTPTHGRSTWAAARRLEARRDGAARSTAGGRGRDHSPFPASAVGGVEGGGR